MSDVRISGIGIVSPFGTEVGETWTKVRQGLRPPLSQLTTSLSERTYPFYAVPSSAIRTFERNSRLRRSSEISHFAAIAGMNALRDAGLEGVGENVGVVFAISSGGVRYTTRFYHDIITTGAGMASPLLFPETVYNAPASHLAALLGLDGLSYTLVGDSAIGFSAISFGEDLVASRQLDHCVVVATEEAEWILCEAFRRSRFFKMAEETRPFARENNRGTVFSEGAAAIVLSREGSVDLAMVHRGVPFLKMKTADLALQKVLIELGSEPDLVFCGANGTAFDDCELKALDSVWPGAARIACKASLGESVGAGSLQQIVLAAQVLREGEARHPWGMPKTAGVCAIGYNALASGAVLEKN